VAYLLPIMRGVYRVRVFSAGATHRSAATAPVKSASWRRKTRRQLSNASSASTASATRTGNGGLSPIAWSKA